MNFESYEEFKVFMLKLHGNEIEYQKKIAQSFLDISRTDRWRNKLLEDHASKYIEFIDNQLKEKK